MLCLKPLFQSSQKLARCEPVFAMTGKEALQEHEDDRYTMTSEDETSNKTKKVAGLRQNKVA